MGASLHALPIDAPGPDGLALTIDVAHLGSADAARMVVVSSGVHGVEGVFGSTVQRAVLAEGLAQRAADAGVALLMLHALNPFGFAWGRRVNEDNVDLNRNFLTAGQSFAGSPDGYAALDAFLNPPTAPSATDGLTFFPRAALRIARHGMPALKNAVAGGQYDFPRGLFYGGSGPTQTQDHLRRVLPELCGAAERVLHVDLHTGLGAWGTYRLFVDHGWGSTGLASLRGWFGPGVEPWEPEQGVSYEIRGGLGAWCKELLPGIEYDVLAAEFGTLHALRVVRALHLENRGWHMLQRQDPRGVALRRALVDTFAPPAASWRRQTVPAAVAIVAAAVAALAPAGTT